MPVRGFLRFVIIYQDRFKVTLHYGGCAYFTDCRRERSIVQDFSKQAVRKGLTLRAKIKSKRRERILLFKASFLSE